MVGTQLATKGDLRAVLRKIKRTSGPRVTQVIAGGEDSVRYFRELNDVPDSYAGAGNFLVRISRRRIKSNSSSSTRYPTIRPPAA